MLFWGHIFQYLLIAPRVLLVVVAIALCRRGLYRQFPIFLAYIAQEIVQSIVLVAMIESASTTREEYTIAYSLGYAISTAFRFGVLYEIFANVFRNYAALERLGKPLFQWATIVFLLIGFCLAAYTGVHGPQLLFVEHLFDRTTSILQCGLLITLFMFASHLGLSWRSHVFGISLGIGINASADLAASAIRSQTGLTYQTPLNYMVMAVYQCCVLIWIFYLFAPERSYAPAALPQHDLESWNLELERLLKP
jgi:hypothetical protein